jgi:hypothetical protein
VLYLSRVFSALLVIGMMLTPARAADISYKLVNGVNLIFLSGEIKKGDLEKFQRIAPAHGHTGVFLSSPGGIVMQALAIGEIIHSKRYDTVVGDDAICASACGLMWLAGSSRLVSNTAKIGFHAAYVGDGNASQASGVGNAFIGAYLTRIGLPLSVVAFVTTAGPGEMKWLHPSDALKLGIKLRALDSEPVKPVAPKPVEMGHASSAELRTSSSVTGHDGHWSRAGKDADPLAQYYGNSADFYR